MQGFVKLPREILTHQVFKHPMDYRLFSLILANANFSDEYEYKGYKLKKGQWIRSLRKLQMDLEYYDNNVLITPSIQKIRTSITRLNTAKDLAQDLTHFCSTLNTPLGTLFTLNEVLINMVFGHTDVVDLAQPLAQKSPNLGTAPSTISRMYLKNNILKKNITTTSEDVRKSDKIYSNFYDVFYQSYGRMMTPIQQQEMSAYIDIDGIEEDMLCFAMEIASKVSSHINYMKAIVNKWISKGIKTYSDAVIENNRQRGGNDGKGTKDIVKDIDFGW